MVKSVNMYAIREFVCLGCGKAVRVRRPKKCTRYCSLECFRHSVRPTCRKGREIKCGFCETKIYRPISRLVKCKNYFCSQLCANKFQGRNKLRLICKTCGKEFWHSKSRPLIYCSLECRNRDEEWIKKVCIHNNLIQQNKKGLNKLELAGRGILENLGLKKDIDFGEQVLMFGKFLVDVLLPLKKIIIQWDGTYWHSKRKNLDISQDAYLKKCGYLVLRFSDIDIKCRKGEVIENINRAIQ